MCVCDSKLVLSKRARGQMGGGSAVKLFLLGLSVQEDIFDKCTLNNRGGGCLRVVLRKCYFTAVI